MKGLDEDASEAIGEDAQVIEPLIRYYATLAKKLGFSDHAQLGVFFQSDKQKDNPNENVHRDGVGARAMLAAKKGEHIRSVRFVYPIGRPGTILYPDLEHEGAPVKRDQINSNPSEEDQILSPRFMTVEGEERQRLLEEAQATQLVPGATLVFDMANSPWHQAPPPTPDGAVMTVGVFESW